MLHGEVEEAVDIVLDSVRGQIRDEEGEDILALGGDVVHRRLVIVGVGGVDVHRLLLLLVLLLVMMKMMSVGRVLGVVVRMRERCDSHRAGRAGWGLGVAGVKLGARGQMGSLWRSTTTTRRRRRGGSSVTR